MPFEAIIFDCDGTLVDSEVLGIQVLVECVAEIGLAFPMEEAVARFTGAKMADSIALIEQRLGHPVPSDFVPEMRRRMAAVFRELSIPYCVASNGPREKMEVSLQVTGLLPYFQGRIFSAYDIGSWKPAPQMFLHAAQALGVAPERCAVVEDSILGAQAGKAAGMTVFGYDPTGDDAILSEAGAQTFSSMACLLPLMGFGG
jgi:HAD superfamily hydrolase (TIGR01509 family)